MRPFPDPALPGLAAAGGAPIPNRGKPRPPWACALPGTGFGALPPNQAPPALEAWGLGPSPNESAAQTSPAGA
ncbi:hypothetical protein QFZ82_003215 [Streptomyces sp. V4I23]|nr:hypothetical protein [Streptomyces sp. V4I23]